MKLHMDFVHINTLLVSHVVVYSLDKFCMKQISMCYTGLSHLSRNLYGKMHSTGRVIVTMEQIVVHAITDSL